MIRWLLRQCADFNPESRYDWFLFMAMLYLLFVVASMFTVPEAPPLKPAFTPYG